MRAEKVLESPEIVKQYGTIDLCLDVTPATPVAVSAASPLSGCSKSPPRSTPEHAQLPVPVSAAAAGGNEGNRWRVASFEPSMDQFPFSSGATPFSGVNRSLVPAFESCMERPPDEHGYVATKPVGGKNGDGLVSDLREFKWGRCPKHHGPLFVHTYASGPKRGIPHALLGFREQVESLSIGYINPRSLPGLGEIPPLYKYTIIFNDIVI